MIDPDYIRIMIAGHQHPMFTDPQERLIQEDVKEVLAICTPDTYPGGYFQIAIVWTEDQRSGIL